MLTRSKGERGAGEQLAWNRPGPRRPETGILALQAAAGNRAVASLLAQRVTPPVSEDAPSTAAPDSLAAYGLTPADAVDSEIPEPGVGAVSDEVVQTAPGVQRGQKTTDLSNVQRRTDGALVVQRKSSSCPPYFGYSAAISLATYNCAGLAHRTYDFKSLAATKALLAGGRPGSSGVAGQIKHWLWEYDLHLEDSTGRRVTPDSKDFHTVAGEIDSKGADPDDVYSKNGRRPVYGPGTGPSFKPPAREQARKNEPSEAPLTDSAGQPIYKVREGFKESTFALNCTSTAPPIQGPPAP